MSQNQEMTNFQCVGEFHEVFGHPKPATLQKNILSENPKLAQFRLSLIREEFNELNHAVEQNDMVEVIDALGDILYVVYGMGQAFGIDLDRAFRIVHASNMSKLCKNEQEAKETIEHYKTVPGFENVEVKYRLASDGKHYVIYNSETGKILKSKYFTLPDFSEMVA
ncbi:nucleoside triphosphate pyrophosphohydrolase [Tupanvirus deep ocean]|uniref:Nucleoside triphosphate pyrophosphohydrolase n=2 Tax=Tupanvirus TaxID=2094720 RepID=A0AC62A8U4_9VIRU|nr:nucleoside triphosphate pyrophosphohydrolase [Tupanvirus deep ocean]QKU34195.1 nucleoside triphosphate pyrophosphohydrolase [Tupanvirus deep ocean]